MKNLGVYDGEAPAESVQLERDGWTRLEGVFTPAEVDAMRAEIETAFEQYPSERSRSDKDEFRYEMLNRSAACQRAVGAPRVLATIEPLLGNDCHVIANTAWRNPPDFAGGLWHTDAGPHVPRPEGVPWDDRVPYPVFVVATHFLLEDCRVQDGPTEVVPGSHRSGRMVPYDRLKEGSLSYEGNGPVQLEGAAGDVLLFVSDVWHRGSAATPDGRGRFFLQVHYGRRDIAQRIRTTDEVNQCAPEAIARATTDRERELIGLHNPFFYDG
jgi:ectoine hydroxylase-related dioxygenase (phytanoyl-CoA dioxygenase family)